VVGLALACTPKGDKQDTARTASADTAAAGPAAATTPAPTATTPAGDTSAAASSTQTAATAGKGAASDSAAGSGAQVKTRAETPHKEAVKLDTATRIAAHQGARTRDTASTGHVTPAPATRKTSAAGAAGAAGAAAAKDTNQDTSSAAAGAGAATKAAGASSDSDTTKASPSQAGQAGQTAADGGAAAGKDPLLASPAEYEGWKTFHVYCYRCHGVDAMGSDLAPNLRHSVGPEGSVTHDVFITTVTNGRLEKGMPSWKELLDRQQMENVYAYLKARSSERLAPGRPHKAPGQ
jgi:mono/diheme cytochrome c family protein